jgi:hypothetical protein
MRRHTSWHLWLILISNICVTLILVFTQYWSVLSTHHHDDASVVLFELMLQRVYIIFSYWSNSVILNTHLRPSVFWLHLFFAIVSLEQRNYSFAKNVLTIERIHYCIVLWLANSEASAHETSCLQSTVSAAGLSNLTMLHSQWTDSWLSSSSLSVC